jgi:hypothetical protein
MTKLHLLSRILIVLSVIASSPATPAPAQACPSPATSLPPYACTSTPHLHPNAKALHIAQTQLADLRTCLQGCLDQYHTCSQGFTGRTVAECKTDVWDPCSAACHKNN